MKHTGLYILSIMAATLTLLTGCTTEDAMETPDNPVGNSAPLTFSAKVNTIGTRAGDTGTGSIDYSVLTEYGFGVFAYGVKGGDRINTPVTYKGADNPVDNLGDVHEHTANWSYSNEIIWGNQIISFLAYAPYYVERNDGTAPPKTGITKVTGSSVDDTKIEYTIATDPTQGVDLLWGVREDANKDGEKRLPWLKTATAAGEGVENVASGGGITFSFHHALSAIAFHVQAMIDKDNDPSNYEDSSHVEGILGENHKITLKSITLSGDFYKQAELNLNNTKSGKPNWIGHSGSENTLTVANNHINPAFKHPDESETTSATTAETIINSTTITGITQEAEQLVIRPHSETKAEQCFFVIPNEEEQTYYLTVNWCLSYKKSDGTYDMEEHTPEPIKVNLTLKPETKYYLNLVFGLKSVRLNVTATDWENNPINMEDIIENGTSANESLSRPLK